MTFTIELTRGGFYENYHQLGRSPEHYFAEAEVFVGQDTAELTIREAINPHDAVDALAESLADLRREAARRPPTAEAWRPAD